MRKNLKADFGETAGIVPKSARCNISYLEFVFILTLEAI